jgi:hypothetical protein
MKKKKEFAFRDDCFQQLMVICIKEYEFLFLIANQLNIEKGGLMIYFIKNYQSYL